jgi:hypothetical protein
MDARPKASPAQVREFFEADGARKVETKELLRLKKSANGEPLPDYDQIAYGIGDGSLTY